MNTNRLTRSIPYWLLLLLSLVAVALGGWLIASQVGTMTTTLIDGTATGIEVYVGQSWIVVGAALLGAGVLGVLLALTLAAVKALLPVAAPTVVEPIDWALQNTEIDTPAEENLSDSESESQSESQEEAEPAITR